MRHINAMNGRKFQRRIATLAAAGFLALSSTVTQSCQAKATAIMLRVSTDIPQGPGQTLTAVRVVIHPSDSTTNTYSRTFELLGTDTMPLLPATLPIVPLNDDATRILVIEVSALQANTVLFTNQAVVGFEREKTTLLEMFLADRCRIPANQVCAAGSTCGQRGCEPAMRSRLPDFVPNMMADASVDRPTPVDDRPNQVIDVPSLPDASFDVPIELDVPTMIDVPSAPDASFDVPSVDRPDPVDIPTLNDTGVAPRDVPNGGGAVTCGPANTPLSAGIATIDVNGAMATLDTNTGTLRGANVMLTNCVNAPPSVASTCAGVTVIDQAGAPQLLVIDSDAFNVLAGSSLRITGARGVVFRSRNGSTISGIIDASGAQGVSGMINAGGAGGAGGPGAGAGGQFVAGPGCDGRNGSAAGAGGGQTGSCGSAGGRGANAVGGSGGGGGGGGSCGGGGASGGSFARPGSMGESGGPGAAGSDGAGGGGTGGVACNSMAPPGSPMPYVFDSTLIPLRGGFGGAAGGFGALHGFGGTGAGASAGAGGLTGFAGGGGGGGGAGGAVALCSAISVRIVGTGELRSDGGLGGVGGFADVAENGFNASVVGMGAAGGGGGAGGSGAGGGGGGGSGGAIFLQAPVIEFQGRLSLRGGLAGAGSAVPRSGGFGGVGRNGGSQGGRGGTGGSSGAGGSGGVGAVRVISPMFINNGVLVAGLLRQDAM